VFLILILKETFVLKCLASHFDNIETWKVNVGQRDIYNEKKIVNYFLYVEVRTLVKKLYIYERHISPMSVLQTCWLETASMCLNTRLRVKNFEIPYVFIEIKITVGLFCAHTVMTSIIYDTRNLTQ